MIFIKIKKKKRKPPKAPTARDPKELVSPLLLSLDERGSRRKLCRLHKELGTDGEYLFSPDGEYHSRLIASEDGLKLWVRSPDGYTTYTEYNADGNMVHINGQTPDGESLSQQ